MRGFILTLSGFGPKKWISTYRLSEIATFFGFESVFCADKLPFTMQVNVRCFSAHMDFYLA
jgi:sec-independent protein translocase protein TatC